jgi:hypothetical protein
MSTHTHSIARNATKTGAATVPDPPSLAAYAKAVDLAALVARVAALEAAGVPVTPPPVTPPPSGSAFLAYPRAAGPNIINGGHDVEITAQSYVGVPGQPALQLVNCQRVWVHDLDFADNCGCVYAMDCSDVRVEDIRARNTGDGTIGSGHSNVVQFNRVHGVASAVRRVKSLGGWTEDVVSIYDSGGDDATHPLIVEDLLVQGDLTDQPAWHSWTTNPLRNSGSALMMESAHHVLAQRIHALNSGQGGIGFNGGGDVTVQDCILYGAQCAASNVGLYALVAPDAGQLVHWLRNRSWWRHGPIGSLSSGYENAWWSADGSISTVGGNVWMDATIDPKTLAVVL